MNISIGSKEIERNDALMKMAHYLMIECSDRGLVHSRIMASALANMIQQELVEAKEL